MLIRSALWIAATIAVTCALFACSCGRAAGDPSLSEDWTIKATSDVTGNTALYFTATLKEGPQNTLDVAPVTVTNLQFRLS